MKKVPVILLITVLVILMAPPMEAEAKDIVDIPDFERLNGDAKYLGKKYRDNYYLDIEETGLLDSGNKIINDIANILFSVTKNLAYLVVCIFYFAMDFDIGALLAPQLRAIQNALNASIFKPLFVVAFAGTSFILIKRMIRRDMIGAATEIFKVLGIVALSMLLVTRSGQALSYATNITKGISKDALTSVTQGNSSGKSFSSTAAGTIWKSLLHVPWKTLEFNNSSYKESDVERFLTVHPDKEERGKLVEEFDGDCFNKNRGGARIGFLVIYLIPFLIKSAIYLLVAVFQLLFQLLAIFYLLCAPIILILALLPGYDSCISMWLKKILETQISILIITFMMGLLIKMDLLLGDLTPTYGWFIVLIFQTVVSIGLFLKRNELLHMFTNIQNGISRPGYAKAGFIKSGNIYKSIENINAKNMVKNRKTNIK